MVTDVLRPDQMLSFSERVRQRARAQSSWLCVGIDPDPEWLPRHTPRTVDGVVDFCKAIIEATLPYAAAYKINFAFFEALGPAGWAGLERVRTAVPSDAPVIADAKRGDIGNTDIAYARAILDILNFDAVTVSPYLGRDSVEPFTSYPGKAALLLCKTSNPGASDFQDLSVDEVPLYLRVARVGLGWAGQGEVGLVVGANQRDALQRVRALSDDVIMLLPGVGAQGASARDAIACGGNKRGENALASVSRQILCASNDSTFAETAGKVAKALAHETWTATDANY